MRGAREAFSHPPEDFINKEAFQLKRSGERKDEKRGQPEVKLRLIKTENPQEHANAIDQAQKRAEALADKNKQPKKEEVIAVQISSSDLKAQLDQVPRWQFWRTRERTVLQVQLDQTLKREKEVREAKKERLKEVHRTLEQHIDGPALNTDSKQQERVTTTMRERESSQEKILSAQEQVTSAQVIREINELKKDLKKVSWWKVTDKALMSRRIQAKEFQLNKLQSEPKKRERSPFEQEEQNLRELTDRRNALSGVERDKASQRVDAAYNRLQEVKRRQSNTEGENTGEERKAA